MTQEMETFLDAKKAFDKLEKDDKSIAEKYLSKYGSADGSATEEELDKLMKKFSNL